MPKRTSKLTRKLKELGEIQVTDWDFAALLNKDIGEIEIRRSLRKLANLQVMNLDCKTNLPSVDRLANREIDLIDLIKRTASYRVIEWDFKNAPSSAPNEPLVKRPNPEVVHDLINRLKKFLEYLIQNLIDEPDHAQIKVQEIEPGVLRFKLVLIKRDVAMLIGREGHTASAIRNMLKSAARPHAVHALLEIQSYDEEMKLRKHA